MTERCSWGATRAGEPMAGTAPRAIGWVALEQPGPWGARAFTESHLSAEIGAVLQSACAEHGLRPLLLRRPGRHPDRSQEPEAPREVLVAHTSPADAWMLEGRIDRPQDLLGLDWAAVAAGDQEAAARSLATTVPSDAPALLVCTNGSRDRCCAIDGRQVALAAHDLIPDRVWETTHLSGHRFSATAVALPSGQVHGRLTPDQMPGLVGALVEGRTPLTSLRGRSTWGPREQAAEIAVREVIGEDVTDAIVSVGTEPDGTVAVHHRDGRRWAVEVHRETDLGMRRESCGKAPVAMTPLRARVLPIP